MPSHQKPKPALIAIGSNLGERRATIDYAVDRLGRLALTRLEKVSRYHETEPIGGPTGQGPFLNACALLATSLTSIELFGELQKIENDAGRTRIVHWGERTLDLDLILYSDAIIQSEGLVVPHPRMAHRSFVLEPAAEIAGTMVDPWTRRTIRDLRDNLSRRPKYLALVAPIGPRRDQLVADLASSLHASLLAGERSGGDSLTQAGPTSSSTTELHDQFAEASQSLSLERWPKSDTWVVSDFWIDQFYISAQLQFASNTCRLLPFRDRFLTGRSNLLQPTLVAFWDPPELTWNQDSANVQPHPEQVELQDLGIQSLTNSWRRLRRAYYDYRETIPCRDPVLIISSPDREQVLAEILSACRSSSIH